MALRREKFAATGVMVADNEAKLSVPGNKKRNEAMAKALAVSFAVILDAIVNDEVTHVTFGMPRGRNAVLCTLNYPDKSQQRCAGINLEDLASKMLAEFTEYGGEGGEWK
jgi:hypothetical protein